MHRKRGPNGDSNAQHLRKCRRLARQDAPDEAKMVNWFEELPEDVLENVLLHVDVHDLMVLAVTCKSMRSFVLSDYVWKWHVLKWLDYYDYFDHAPSTPTSEATRETLISRATTRLENLWNESGGGGGGGGQYDIDRDVFTADGQDVKWYCIFRFVYTRTCAVCKIVDIDTCRWIPKFGQYLCRRFHYIARRETRYMTYITQSDVIRHYRLPEKLLREICCSTHSRNFIHRHRMYSSNDKFIGFQYNHERIQEVASLCYLGSLRWVYRSNRIGDERNAMARRCRYLLRVLVLRLGFLDTHVAITRALRYGIVTPRRKSWIDKEALAEQHLSKCCFNVLNPRDVRTLAFTPEECLELVHFVLGTRSYKFVQDMTREKFGLVVSQHVGRD